jgi:hypothetical protein
MSAILFTFFHSVLTNLVGIFKIFHDLESFQEKYYEVFKSQLSSFSGRRLKQQTVTRNEMFSSKFVLIILTKTKI